MNTEQTRFLVVFLRSNMDTPYDRNKIYDTLFDTFGITADDETLDELMIQLRCGG